MKETEIIGKTVLSSKFGIGIVTGVDDLGLGDKQFLVIETEQRKVKNFIPIEDTDHYRLLETKAKLQKVIKELSKKSDGVEFESRQERINYFKDASRIQDVTKIKDLLIHLYHLDDKGTLEDSIYDKLLETLALECSIVMEMDKEKARESIVDQLKTGA